MLILDVIVSAFAAWGIICALKFTADGYLREPKARPRPLVRVDGKETDAELRALCEVTRKAIVCNRGEIVIMIPEGMSRDEFEDRLRELGLCDVCVVSESRILSPECRETNQTDRQKRK